METQYAATCSKINATMMELFELPADKLTPEAHLFADLGLDSLDAIDLIMKFQTEFGMTLSNQEMQSIRTMSDVYALVKKATDQNISGATQA